MNLQSVTKYYMLTVIVIGFICLIAAVFSFTLPHTNHYELILLAVFTIALGSRITLKIPQFKSHIAVSDTFIFLTLMLFGGEAAIVLSAVEAIFSSWRFCKKKITVLFNAAAMACSTTSVVLALKFLDFKVGRELNEVDYTTLIVAISLMAIVQFITNSLLASIYGSIKSNKPLWETWKTQYLWSFLTYFVGAITAGILAKLFFVIGFSVIIAAAPIILLLYFTYRTYLTNIEMSLAQAGQAKEHAEVLEQQSIALRESEERFRSAFTYAPIGIGLISAEGRWLKVNNALQEILGFTEEEFLNTDFQSLIHPDDLGEALINFHHLLTGKIVNSHIEQRFLHRNGTCVWVLWTVSSATPANSEKATLIIQIQDITARKSAEEALQHKATHDSLTGLPNRSLFMSRLETALQKSKIEPEYKVSLLFIDLDRFKMINDSLGHIIGDQLLVGIAQRLNECLRPSDLVARLGGDEFTILVEGRHQIKEVVRIAERVKEKFSAPFNLNGNEVYSSASIGILHSSENHHSSEDLMRDADIAMYQAKRLGKGNHAIFSSNMHQEVKESLLLETELHRAIEKQEIAVNYQPIVCFETKKIIGFEALARWYHPEVGVILPSKFVPLAEEIGLINKLSFQILEQACEQGKIWQDMFPEHQFFVSINISCKQFSQLNLVEDIKRVLNKTGLESENLKLEITESIFFENRENSIQMLHAIRNLGIEIFIDDFGTGYSNLSCLTQLPVSTLKIDRSFIAPIENDTSMLQLVEIVVLLARNLNMKIIAEGVETEFQLKKLKHLNCEYAQGYLFSPPLPAKDTTEFLIKSLSELENRAIPPQYQDLPSIQSLQQF